VIAIPDQAPSRQTFAVTVVKFSCRTPSARPIWDDNVKSSAPLAVAGVLGCILIAGCVQTREANVPSPPATSYQVGSFELQESGSSQKVRGASVTPAFFQSVKISTLLGRGFLPEEYSSGTHQVGKSPSLAKAISWGPTNNRHQHTSEWTNLYRDWDHANDVRKDLQSLHDDPRFATFVAKARQPVAPVQN
jgi:hypothetical protein